MAQIFHPSMNVVAKATIFGGIFILSAVVAAGGAFVRSSYVTQVDVVRDQPVPFSHQHHVSELGLDCRYCHSTVETSAFAGMPATELCMGCHSQIWKNSEMLQPVRDSLKTGKPLSWTRVHDLPDFVYFNHSIHVAKGIGCESCHGRVDEMPLMRRVAPLHMEWCLHCHRHPELSVRPEADLFRFGLHQSTRSGISSQPTMRSDKLAVQGTRDASANVGEISKAFGNDRLPGGELVKKYQIATKQLSDCVVCHR